MPLNKMMNFCTLFDSYYIHKGIALYLSLENVTDDFHLYVMAFDKDCFNKLKSLDFKHLTVELVDDFETPELLNVKPTRSKTEYCWTCGPSIIYYFINKFNLPSITYVDADLWFLHNPQIAFDEIGKSSIAITEHFYDPNNIYVRDSPAGKYCVQFMYFKNDSDGMSCLRWWRDRCIEWCYSRYEEGKCGDQKYLESFEVLFNNVHVIKNRAVPIAPWNMDVYEFMEDFKIKYNEEVSDIVFFHMHGVVFDNEGSLLVAKARYEISKDERTFIFLPYTELIKKIYKDYLGIETSDIKIQGRTRLEALSQRTKLFFRRSKLVQYFYYSFISLLNIDHATKEKRKF